MKNIFMLLVMHISQLELGRIKKTVLNLKKDCNLTNKYHSKSVIFWQYHSFKPMIFKLKKMEFVIIQIS